MKERKDQNISDAIAELKAEFKEHATKNDMKWDKRLKEQIEQENETLKSKKSSDNARIERQEKTFEDWESTMKK